MKRVNEEIIDKAIINMTAAEKDEYILRLDAEHEEVKELRSQWTREFINDLDYETKELLLAVLAEYAINDGEAPGPGEWRALPMLLLWIVALAPDAAFLDAIHWIKCKE